jgi:hypothetical protein
MNETEVPFILGPYRAQLQHIDIQFKKDADYALYEMIRMSPEKEDTQAKGKGYTIHIRRYTISVRFRERFDRKEIYERGRNQMTTYGADRGNMHVLDVETNCIVLMGTMYASLDKQLDVIKNYLLYDTFQEETSRKCFMIESIVGLNFEIDRMRLVKDHHFRRVEPDDEADGEPDYSLHIKYSALPSSSIRLVPVGNCIEQFEDITTSVKPYGTTRNSAVKDEDEDFDIIVIINASIIAVIVRGDRSHLVKAHTKLHTLFCKYGRI